MNRDRKNTAALFLSLLLVLPNISGFTVPEAGAAELRRFEEHAGADIGAFCGMAEHTHTDGCLEKRLACGLEETEGHAHSVEAGCCAEMPKLICAKKEHAHTDDCLEKTLVCTLKEDVGHAHSMESGCYEAGETAIICGAAEHVHSAGSGCYAELPVLCCAEEHEHGEGCYAVEQQLVCQTAEHTHMDTCRHTEYVLVCEETERAGHSHGAPCYAALEGAAYVCGYAEEHSHSRSCFEEMAYLCGKTEREAHKHGEGCYVPVEGGAYICGLSEHRHTLSCYADPQADTESSEVWERTLAGAVLCGSYTEDVLAVAKTQLGYCESRENYIVTAGHKSGYTRYGAWYGMPYADWCAMFLSFCLYYAGVPEAAFPKAAHCQLWINALSSDPYKLYERADEGDPRTGDLLFLDWDGDGESDHVGLICELIAGEGGQIEGVKTIEGNYGDRVTENEHRLDEPSLMGYGRLSRAGCVPTAKVCLGSDGLSFVTSFAGASGNALGGHSVELSRTGRNARDGALISVAVVSDYERWTLERLDGGLYRAYAEDGDARRYLSGGRMEGIRLVLEFSDTPEEAAGFVCAETGGEYVFTASKAQQR